MIKIQLSSIAASMLALSLTAPAHATGVTRAWVSGHGTDAAGCGAPTDPCRSLQYVHDSIIAAGGEIDILDPAGYGAVTISKALSIVNDGVGTAGVQEGTSGASAVTFNGGTNDILTLRGLNIDGLGTGSTGIAVNSGGGLTVVNCVVRHFTANGIEISPSGGAISASISNTIASDNLGSGIEFRSNGSGSVTGVISGATTNNNGFAGISMINQSAGGASATVVDSIAYDNGTGFLADHPGANLLIGHSVSTGNTTGVLIENGATGSSYGDNKIKGANTTDVTGTLSPLSLD
jgi:hypothetical protein